MQTYLFETLTVEKKSRYKNHHNYQNTTTYYNNDQNVECGCHWSSEQFIVSIFQCWRVNDTYYKQ